MNQSNKPIPNKYITNIFGDSYLPYINSKKFEEIAYSTYFDIDILSQLSKEFTFYIFIGTDSGMLLKHLQRLNTDPGSTYLFIEDSKIIQQINKDILDIKKSNILISTIDNWQNDCKNADIIKYIEVDRVQTIKSFSAQEQTYLPYTTIAQTLHDVINQLKWIHPDKFQKKIYIQRQIENCSENFNPAIKLKGLLKGKSALILAGGPSLDDYIDWIEEHQQYYVVIAVSRTARRLLSTKIVPDIFVTADPFESAFTTSKEVLAFGEKSILVSQNYAHPRLIGQWQGQHFYLGKLLPWETDYQPENITAIGPTVTNGAIHLAIQMGIIDQVLFGVDLCHSTEGYTHVSQTIERDQGADLGFAGTPVTTNNGNQENTTYEMLEARTSISVLAELAEKQGGQIINPSPSSAAIKNVSYLPLSKIKVPTEEIPSFVGTYSFSEHKPNHHSNILDEFKKLKDEAKQILDYSKEIIDSCDKQYEENNSETNSEIIDELSSIENRLKSHDKLITIIESFGINGYYDFIHPEQINKPSNKLDVTRRYYTSLYIASDSFIDIINNSIKQIEDHIKSDSTQEKQKRSIINFKEFFTFNKNEQASKTDIIRLEGLEKKLYHFFQNKKIDNLSQIIQQISSFNSEESISLIHLAQGYLYELNGETDQAINEYLNANGEQTLESGLKRILDITLRNGDIENTITVLHALSDISPDYLIQLANLSQIGGQHKDALETYSLYIDQNPDDILILIKMGLLYLSLDILDGAEFVFNHILTLNNKDLTSLIYLQKIKHSNLTSSFSTHKKILYLEKSFLEIEEYYFYKSINDSNLNFVRLENSEKNNTIGFILTKWLLQNKKYRTYLTKLYQKFSNVNFVVFYLNNNIKNSVSDIFGENLNRIKLIKPKNIYQIVENVEIFIHFRDITWDYSKSNNFKRKKFLILNNLMHLYCKNIYNVDIVEKWLNDTCDESSLRMTDSKLIKNYKALGLSEQDMKNGHYKFVDIICIKALNNKAFVFNKKEKTTIEMIKIALNHKRFIHFSHQLYPKIQALLSKN